MMWGYEGLDTLIRAGFQGPVHIVRQTISLCETQIRRISAYHRFEGLSRAARNGGTKKDRQYPYRYNKPYILAMRFGRYVDIRFEGLL
jgi:hypothetical protein